MKLLFKFKKDDIEKKLREAASKVFSKDNMTEFLDSIARSGKQNIQKRAGFGGSVEKDLGKKKPFKRLAKSTIKARTYSKKLSSKTVPKKSNLTHTRQMLDSIRGKGTGIFRGEIYLLDKRKGSSVKNSELAEWHEKGTKNMPARPFLHLSDKEYESLQQAMDKKLKAYLKKVK